MRRTVAAAALLCALAAGGRARANMASPVTPGDLPTEPAPALRGLAVAHETLAIDLRGLALGEDAQVTATYRVRNDGAARTVPLVFVAPELREPEVRVDGAPLTLRPADATALPTAWAAPETVPTVDGGELRYDTLPRPQVVAFDAPLPAGEHEVTVRYAATPGEYHGPVYRERRFVYLLAPARRWESFGALDVAVSLPAGWEAVATPALTREGDTLRGRFQGLPADHLAIATRKPVPDVPDGALRAVVPSAGALLIFAAAWVSARRARGGRRLGAGVVLATVLGATVLAAVLPAAGGAFAALFYDGAELSRSFRYGRVLAGIYLGVLAAPVGALLAAVALWLSRRRPPAPRAAALGRT